MIMKFKILASLLLFGLLFLSVTVFSRAQVNQPGTLTSPTEANAGFDPFSTLTTIYNVMCTVRGVTGGSDDCAVNRDTWSGGLVFLDLGFNTGIARTICNRSGDDVTVNGQLCYDPQDYAYNDAMLKSGRYPGGLAATTAQTYAYVTKEAPTPTNLALYLHDLTNDTFINTPVYAAGPVQGTVFEQVIFNVWKVTRDIALALVGVLLGYSALLVIFRRRLTAQTFVSISNVLPAVPIVIVLIVLSYPIIAVVLKAIGPMIYMSVWAVTVGFLGFTGGVNNAVSEIVTLAINSAFSISASLPAFSMSILMMIGVVAGSMVISLILGIISAIRAYASLFVTTVISPLVLLMAILPGKMSLITNLGKRILIDMLTIPLVIAVIMLGALIVSRPINISGSNSFAYLPYFWYGSIFFLYITKSIIGIMIMLQSRKVRTILESTIKVGNLFGIEEQQKQRR